MDQLCWVGQVLSLWHPSSWHLTLICIMFLIAMNASCLGQTARYSLLPYTGRGKVQTPLEIVPQYPCIQWFHSFMKGITNFNLDETMKNISIRITLLIFVYLQYCTDHEVSDKAKFPTFARTKPHDSQISKALVSLLQHFDWKKVVFIHNDKKLLLAETLQEVRIFFLKMLIFFIFVYTKLQRTLECIISIFIC